MPRTKRFRLRCGPFPNLASQAAWKPFSGEVLTSCSINNTLSFQGNGADLFDILDGTIHWTDADGGGGREGEADQGELENGKAPKTVPGFTI